MTLNAIIALIWRFSPPNSIALLANYVTVVEGRPIMSAKYRLPVSVFHFWPQLTHSAAQSLCDSWATCCCSYRVSFSVLLDSVWLLRNKRITHLLLLLARCCCCRCYYYCHHHNHRYYYSLAPSVLLLLIWIRLCPVRIPGSAPVESIVSPFCQVVRADIFRAE